uniref:SET domain-containing protein n=1 Tax=Tetradesmus obliquus TaxID=3088 RepID=A0A383WPZ8_TETOB|eukprot:jgi/Sobl393_1/6414/SZX79515.1
MSFDEVATIDKGVVIRQSSISGAGNGLFTGRPFFRNDLITEYCGPIIDHQKALKLRKRGKATHVRVLNSQWLYIDGLKQPVTGQGGASFANDARKASAYNAVFVQRFDRKLGRDRVFLKASRDLDAYEEVFVSYGNTYWQTSKQRPQLADAQAAWDGTGTQEQEQQLRRSPRQRELRRLSVQQEATSCALQQQDLRQQQQQDLRQQQQQQQQQEVGSQQNSGDSSNTMQQAASAPGARQQRQRALSKRAVMQQTHQGNDQPQCTSSQQVRQQQQQQALPAQRAHAQQQQQAALEGSQESTDTQVVWRRSSRVRGRLESQQQQLEEQQQESQQRDRAANGASRSTADVAGADTNAAQPSVLCWSEQKKRSACSPTGQAGKRSKPSSSKAEGTEQRLPADATATLDGADAAAAAVAGKFTVEVLAQPPQQAFATACQAAAMLTRRGRH